MQAILALEDGRVFRGKGYGAKGECYGEVVFNTSITGYQEIFTDPSYSGQIVVLTNPEIGNYGTNSEDDEATRPWIEGLIVREFSKVSSNWRSEKVAEEYLEQFKVPVLSDIDTRSLVRHLRDHGVMRGVVSTIETDADKLIAKARSIPKMDGTDLAKEVSTKRPYVWEVGERSHEPVAVVGVKDEPAKFHVVAYDFGIKRNILRLLADFGCRVTVVPAQTPADEAVALQPDGIFLSNGPGDPEPCDYAITATRKFLESDMPVFGICLGHQILGLASGAQTVKMKAGHHGANHPVQDLDSGRVFITSQNHGFAVDETTLPENVKATHRSLFDGTLQGLAFKDRPAFGFQGHPEASPGPHDLKPLFERFNHLMLRRLQMQLKLAEDNARK